MPNPVTFDQYKKSLLEKIYERLSRKTFLSNFIALWLSFVISPNYPFTYHMLSKNYGFIRTEYSFTSGSGDLESGRYINEYKIRIYFDETRELANRNREESIEIGRASVSLFLVELGMDNGLSTFDVFDHCLEYVNLYEEIYSESGEFIELIEDSFEGVNFNLLYVRQIELLPEWRGRDLGKKIIKDIIMRFHGCCGIAVLKAFPLQFDEGLLESTNLWHQQLLLSLLTQNSSLAQAKLNSYCKSIGFESIPKTDLHYMSLGRGNPELKQIPLDDAEEL